MTRSGLMLLAGLGSAAMLLAAFGFQYLGGLLPCAMCLWQRWPHAAAVALAVVGVALPRAWVAGLGALSMLTNTGLGLYHTGVERDWWEGPSSCTSGSGPDLGSLSGSDLLAVDTGPGIVMCDEVAWEMLGLSMASYNALASLLFAVIWIAALRGQPGLSFR